MSLHPKPQRGYTLSLCNNVKMRFQKCGAGDYTTNPRLPSMSIVRWICGKEHKSLTLRPFHILAVH